MCGINGAVRLTPASPPLDREAVLRTREHQARRGPDGAGLWESADRRVALAHNRLAILDLSPAGAQPMAFARGRYHLTFNGEIYNFHALRAELRAHGVRFVTDSDTEVVLALYAREGAAMLPRLRGMYAFALWDDVAKTLLLARDSFGIKPLYYATEGGVLRFASQVKSLVAGGGISAQLDLAAVAGFLLWGSVPEPLTLRQSIRQLPAGHYLLVENGRLSEPVRHYRPDRHDYAGERESVASLADALADSVAAHLVSDVPVAVFLSAGLDSGLIAALARRHLPELSTLTVRFPALRGKRADEGPLAARVAAALGTRHRELEVPADDLRTLWPAALAAMDQPSIDGFNTFVIARAAHEAGFKVVLSGLGGDELFGGYPSFHDVPRLQRLVAAARRVPGLAGAWSAVARLARRPRPKAAGLLRYGGTLPGAYYLRRGLFLPEELPRLLGADTAHAALARYDVIADAAAALEEPAPAAGAVKRGDRWLAVHRLETNRYLRHQLLRDSDWAAMAWSVELRVPLVDPVLRAHAAHAAFAPARLEGKAAAVCAAARELPPELFERKKTGFYVPIAEALEPRAAGMSHGARSRLLAMRVLREHGVELPVEKAMTAPAEPLAVG
ncbi:MAG TPA: asparagine synthase (glutamine-hydrolyzing) [Thermoanaerobaculia bacterium]|jgi:asparagine synthase (glutamine-hydrolysing)|nr:asparagine synthase (glutamine-hydrolyzing) [Thermoanaerobaculia bacterium]